MVHRRKNIDLLVTELQIQNPTWSLHRCECAAKEKWDHLYKQQKQIAQVRANRLMMQFMLVSNDKGGIDVVRNNKQRIADEQTEDEQTVYLIVNPEKAHRFNHAG